MTSAGNDIVSLTAINVTRTKGAEFYSKIISPSEKELYEKLEHQTLPFEYFVWLLWSAKEAAFKYLHRLDPKTVFIPVRFTISDLQIPAGYTVPSFPGKEITAKGFDGFIVLNSVVAHKGDKLNSKTLIYKEFISSVVNHAEDFDNVYWGVKRIGNTANKYQSAAVRAFVVDRLQAFTGINEITIEKNTDDVPIVLHGGAEMGVAVSLSHHEWWVGYSFVSEKI